jgi:hypothetical protein
VYTHGATTYTPAPVDTCYDNMVNQQVKNNNSSSMKKCPPIIELNDSIIDLHSSASSENLVKNSLRYLGDLRCQPYSTYFNVSEDYVHPSNSKALRKQITEVLDKCQLYGNIGSVAAMLDVGSIDLHIDLYGNLCHEIKG